MYKSKLIRCPACGGDLEPGFSSRSSPLSWITSEKMRKFASRDEDLNKAGWKMILPAKARYNLAYHCRKCKILVVDYSRKVASQEAKAQAEMLSTKGREHAEQSGFSEPRDSASVSCWA